MQRNHSFINLSLLPLGLPLTEPPIGPPERVALLPSQLQAGVALSPAAHGFSASASASAFGSAGLGFRLDFGSDFGLEFDLILI